MSKKKTHKGFLVVMAGLLLASPIIVTEIASRISQDVPFGVDIVGGFVAFLAIWYSIAIIAHEIGISEVDPISRE